MATLNLDVYQSYWGLYSIKKTYLPNLDKLLIYPNKNWLKLTGDRGFPKYKLKIKYYQPINWNQSDLSLIKNRYIKL